MVLSELARVIRSKNAGPTLLTVDVLFADAPGFARGAAALSVAAVARCYGRAPGDVRVIAVPSANAVKIVLPRAVPAGAPGDRDVYGAQQHAPLLDLPV
jgi:hypothetical protein